MFSAVPKIGDTVFIRTFAQKWDNIVPLKVREVHGYVFVTEDNQQFHCPAGRGTQPPYNTALPATPELIAEKKSWDARKRLFAILEKAQLQLLQTRSLCPTMESVLAIYKELAPILTHTPPPEPE